MNDFYNAMYMIIHVFDIVIMYRLYGVFLGSKPKSKVFAALSYLLYYFATGLIYGNTAQLTPHCHKKSDIL